jgi:peptide/nickel transport system substrate-binding protein
MPYARPGSSICFLAKTAIITTAIITTSLASPAFASGPMPATLAEAPTLAERVKAGQLPPVGERIGKEAMVVKPHQKVGKYGGTLRSALRGGGDHNAILRLVGNQGLVRWNLDMTGVEPNLAQSWTASADGRIFTFKLRDGVRWSDGRPFTSADVLFSMNDLTLNRDFSPATPGRYVNGGEAVKVTAPDAVTVTFTFAQPNGRFLFELATPLGQHPTLYQKAYCSAFHPAMGDKAKIEEQVKARNLRDWGALLRQNCGDIEIPARWGNPERPTLDPWLIVEPYRGGATRVVMQRNPYFWQVDTAGNQLPYIDSLTLPVISDVETILLRTMSGDIDFQARHTSNINNKPVLSENRQRGNFELFDLSETNANAAGLWFNQTHKDPKVRELFRNRNFRIAVSHAINRQEIADSVYLGQAQPYQAGPAPDHPLHNRQLSTQFLKHDPAAAGKLLDELGLNRRDSSGMRLWPDGKRLLLQADFPVNNPEQGDVLNLVKRDLAAVGVDLGVNAIERALFYDRANKNDHEIHITIFPGGRDPEVELRTIVAEHNLDSRQSLEWQKWYESRGRLGEEPTPSMKKRMELLDQWRATADKARADAIFKEILQLAADEFEVVGTVRVLAGPGVRNRRIVNVPNPMLQAWVWATPGPALPQQFFYE